MWTVGQLSMSYQRNIYNVKSYSLPKWPANVEKIELKPEGLSPKNKKRYSVEFEVVK